MKSYLAMSEVRSCLGVSEEPLCARNQPQPLRLEDCTTLEITIVLPVLGGSAKTTARYLQLMSHVGVIQHVVMKTFSIAKVGNMRGKHNSYLNC